MKDKLKKYSVELIILILVIIVLFIPFDIYDKKEEEFEIDIYNLEKIKIDQFALNFSVIKDELPSFNNPIIPTGFKAVNTEDANWNNMEWNNGLVIQDENGNEFVWVPVDNINVKYEKHLEPIKEYNTYISNVNDRSLDKINNKKNKESVDKYGGFYIGRYEAGKSKENKKLIIKKGVIPYNDVSLVVAIVLTSDMYNEKGFKTCVISGIMWDTVVTWIENSDVDVNNSYSWGNYYKNNKNIIYLTGNNEEWKAKNIYDLAGNLWELTLESVNYNYAFIKDEYLNDKDINIYSNFVSMRGGSCMDYNDSNISVLSYNKIANVFKYPYVGFRVALYIN